MVVLNLSVLTSVRRIVKIAVRFLHTKTALCDRKDTQSRFAVNAARSIVCVETILSLCRTSLLIVSMPHAALCVSRPRCTLRFAPICRGFNAARSIVCVETRVFRLSLSITSMFQCRTQHCVCRDQHEINILPPSGNGFNAARSIVCVETSMFSWNEWEVFVSMPHAALCVSRHCVPQPLSRAG